MASPMRRRNSTSNEAMTIKESKGSKSKQPHAHKCELAEDEHQQLLALSDLFEDTYDDKSQVAPFLSGVVRSKTIPRQFRTVEPSTSSLTGSSNDGSLSGSLSLFKSDLVIIERPYAEQYGTKHNPIAPVEQPKLNEAEKLHFQTKTVPLSREIISTQDFNVDTARQRDTQRRNRKRINVFESFKVPKRDVLRSLDKRPSPSLDWTGYNTRKGYRVKFTCKKLQFTIGNLEPFFCTVALYDVVKRVRISEDFHFDINDKKMQSLLGARHVDPETSGKTAVFHVCQPNPNIYAVLRIEHVLRGIEGDALSDPYFRQMKPKEKEKFERAIESDARRLGRFTQGFAWGALPLFNSAGTTLHEAANDGFSVIRLKNDHSAASIVDLLGKDAKKGSDGASTIGSLFRRPIPGTFQFDVKLLPIDEEVPESVDPFLLPVKPFTGKGEVCREMREFEQAVSATQPSIEYENNMYIYPELLNASKMKDSNAKSILVRVELKQSDTDLKGDGLKVFYGRSNTQKLVDKVWCSVTYHKRVPVFYDEVKFRLPVDIGPQHHILFTYFSVQCQEKHGMKNVHEIGHSFLPLLEGKRLVEDGHVTLPIALGASPGYLSSEDTKWVDHKKGFFTLRTHVDSSVYSMDEAVGAFLRCVAGNDDNALALSIQGLNNVDERARVRHLPALLNMLFGVLTSRSEVAARASVTAIASTLKQVAVINKGQERPSMLTAYVTYLFRNDTSSKKLLFEELARIWSRLLDLKHSSVPELTEFSWFLFDIIIKSMTLYADQPANRGRRKGLFSTDYVQALLKLMKLAGHQVALNRNHSFNINVGLFLADCFTVLDRGTGIRLVYTYLDGLHSLTSSDHSTHANYKFEFWRALCSYENFIALNNPGNPVFDTVPTLPMTFWKKHLLIGLFVHQVIGAVHSNDKPVSALAMSTLRDVLTLHDHDDRLMEPTAKGKVADMYFPFMLSTISLHEHHSFEKTGGQRLADWAACWMWVVRNCSRPVLRKWWRSEAQKNLNAFFKAMSMAINVVKDPHQNREYSFIALDLVELFVEDFAKELSAPDEEMIRHMFAVLMLLLEKEQLASFLISLFGTLCRFIHIFKNKLFKERDISLVGDLCFTLLRFTNQNNGIARSGAGSLFYLLIQTNISIVNNMARMKLQSTVAASRLVGESNHDAKYENIQSTLQEVVAQAQKDYQGQQWAGQVHTLVRHLFKLIKDNMQIALHRLDPEMTADLYYKLSRGYQDSPDLRITWLENLSMYHRDRQNWEEVAQCYIFIAALIAEFFGYERPNARLPTSASEFLPFSPSIETEPRLPQMDLDKAYEEGMYNPKTFSEKGLLTTLKMAVSFLKKAQLYEVAMEVYNVLLDIYLMYRDYEKLGDCFRDLKNICFVTCKEADCRIFANFYRVGFYGTGWGELDGVEFIYKESFEVRLMDLSERLKKQFTSIYNKEVCVISSNKPVDRATLDQSKLHFQLATVTEYFEPDELKLRVSQWERKFDVSRFMFETPFTMDGKAHGELVNQYKRKTILTVQNGFPYVKKRLRVVNKVEKVLTPIESASEVLATRTSALRQELETSPPNLNALQIVLQGAVLAQVNAGPIEIARVFLGHREQYSKEHVAMLTESLTDLIRTCGFALLLNKRLIDSDQEAFQQECESGYQALKREIADITSLASTSVN